MRMDERRHKAKKIKLARSPKIAMRRLDKIAETLIEINKDLISKLKTATFKLDNLGSVESKKRYQEVIDKMRDKIKQEEAFFSDDQITVKLNIEYQKINIFIYNFILF